MRKLAEYAVVSLPALGIFIAGTLTLATFMNAALFCGIGNGCEMVSLAPTHKLFHLPFSFYGALAYVAAALLGLARLRFPGKVNLFSTIATLLSLTGTTISFVLVGRLVFQEKLVCTWCYASGITFTLLLLAHAYLLGQDVPNFSRKLTSTFVASLGVAAIGLLVTAFALSKRRIPPAMDETILSHLSNEALLSENPHVLGDPNAKLTVVVFSDLQCPFCEDDYWAFKELVPRRRFNVVYRQRPLKMHPQAELAARLSEMLAEKGKFWEYVDACYAKPMHSAEEYKREAVRLGLTEKEIASRLNNQDISFKIVVAGNALADHLKVNGVPALVLLEQGKTPRTVTMDEIKSLTR